MPSEPRGRGVANIYISKLDLGGKKWEMSDGAEKENDEAKQVQ